MQSTSVIEQNRRASEEIEAQIARFFASGGAIQEIPEGVMAHDQFGKAHPTKPKGRGPDITFAAGDSAKGRKRATK